MPAPVGFALLLAAPLAFALLIVGVVWALATRLPPDQLWAALTAAETMQALRLSLWTSFAALAIALTVALPGGRLLARVDFPGKRLLAATLEAPLFMPPLVAGLGLLFLLGPRLLGEPLTRWGIEVLFSPLGVVAAQAFAATATMLPAARAAFEAVDSRLLQTAATLRASPLSTFFSVEAPLALSGLAAGALTAWARAVSEFGAALMLAGAARGRTETLPMAVFLNIATGETGTAVACGLILLAISALLMACLRLLRPPRRQMH